MVFSFIVNTRSIASLSIPIWPGISCQKWYWLPLLRCVIELLTFGQPGSTQLAKWRVQIINSTVLVTASCTIWSELLFQIAGQRMRSREPVNKGMAQKKIKGFLKLHHADPVWSYSHYMPQVPRNMAGSLLVLSEPYSLLERRWRRSSMKLPLWFSVCPSCSLWHLRFFLRLFASWHHRVAASPHLPVPFSYLHSIWACKAHETCQKLQLPLFFALLDFFWDVVNAQLTGSCEAKERERAIVTMIERTLGPSTAFGGAELIFHQLMVKLWLSSLPLI